MDQDKIKIFNSFNSLHNTVLAFVSKATLEMRLNFV